MRIAVFFPGIGYHCDKPLLYFSRKIASELGYEKIITVDYSYAGENIRGDETKMKEAFEALYMQAEEKLKDLTLEELDSVLFVSKSVGTIIASAYAQKHNIKCKHILFTPLKYTYEYNHEQGIAFIGTDDPWSDVEEVVQMSNDQGISIKVFDGLNHSLESDNTLKNIEVLAEIMHLIKYAI